MASVLDIIKIIGGQKDASSVWQRLRRNEEVQANCLDFQFEDREHSQGQRKTPVISKEGLFLLINAIPGNQAQRVRMQCAQKLVRIMGGDESLIDEIKNNARIAESDPTSSQAFFANQSGGAKNKLVKAVKQPLTDHNIYVRGYDEVVANQQNDKGKGTSLLLTIDLLKFGIAQVLKGRSDKYGEDAGAFSYSIQVPTEEIAKHVEKIFRARFNDITYPNRFEYIYVEPLIKRLPFVTSQSTYADVMRCLYVMMLGELHTLYPALSDSFGVSYKTSLVSSIEGIVTKNEDNMCLATTTTKLTIADLPEYSQIFPSLANQHQLTRRRWCKRLEIEREKTKHKKEKTKRQEAKIRWGKELTRREKEKTKQKKLQFEKQKAKVEEIRLQIELLQLQSRRISAEEECNAKTVDEQLYSNTKLLQLEKSEDEIEEDESESESEGEVESESEVEASEEGDTESKNESEEEEEESKNEVEASEEGDTESKNESEEEAESDEEDEIQEGENSEDDAAKKFMNTYLIAGQGILLATDITENFLDYLNLKRNGYQKYCHSLTQLLNRCFKFRRAIKIDNCTGNPFRVNPNPKPLNPNPNPNPKVFLNIQWKVPYRTREIKVKTIQFPNMQTHTHYKKWIIENLYQTDSCKDKISLKEICIKSETSINRSVVTKLLESLVGPTIRQVAEGQKNQVLVFCQLRWK